jgi:heat-inducible transcriptional repressor
VLTGLTLGEVREKVVLEMGQEKNAYDALVSRALALGTAVLEATMANPDGQALYIEGQTRLFDAPEFGDLAKMKALLRAFEDKRQIIRLLDTTAEAKGIQIFIGAEAPYLEIEDCAVVTAAYGAGDPSTGTLGVIGVIGPARMNYSRVIPLVDCTAKIVSSMLDRGR